MAIFTALICFVLRLKGEIGIIVALLIYILSCLLFQYGFNYGEAELKGKQRVVTLGSGTFVFIWAAVWILLYTLSPY